ncbi:histidine phosphatase family protein [Salipiger abyssi]|uniref:2,3-bisphosphoglycerate-dependent phosphoglycerate mutase n=1 Tax=Salipiger abyssi TaxID=1250539 RepID=A0A1P8UXS6_9RHOB|nr:histidine phosphatase family protein [Salipiger abyssi]APZ54156.1 2,3-bisphosphoglycerate-dependent phosphoglycerate mutase [Salipiger abyssi]
MAEPAYIAFLRHGAYHQRPGAPSARQPFPLTEEGLAQARAGADMLAAMIAEHNLSPAPVIHCSHQLRAWQTADALRDGLRAHGLAVTEIKETPALAERGLGSAANLTVEEIEAVLRDDPRYGPPPPGWKSNSHYRLPLEGAESLTEAGRRVAHHLQAIARPGMLTIHVGHGASFRHACHHLGLLALDDIPKLSMFHARPSLICHDSDGRWRHLAGEWKVRAKGEAPID